MNNQMSFMDTLCVVFAIGGITFLLVFGCLNIWRGAKTVYLKSHSKVSVEPPLAARITIIGNVTGGQGYGEVGKVITVTAFNVDKYCGMHGVTLAVIRHEVAVDDYPDLVNKLKEQHPDVEIVFEAKF